jgi:hypothetical protein
MAQAQLDNGCGTLQSVAGDRVPRDHLWAADSDLLDNDASRVVHDVIAPSSVPLIGEHIMTTETETFLLRFEHCLTHQRCRRMLEGI